MILYFAVCVGILTLTHLIALVVLLMTLAQVRRSAEAVEVLAYQAQDQVEKISDAAARICDFAGSVRSGWIKLMTIAIGASADFLTRMGKRKEDSSSC